MTVSVPEDRAVELGVRDAISLEEVDDVMAVLAVTNVRVPTNWSRRFKNHQEKLKSGDIYECAEVVRNLSLREQCGSLSTAEKSMQARARQILVSELAVSWDVTLDEAGARIDEVLIGSDTKKAGAASIATTFSGRHSRKIAPMLAVIVVSPTATLAGHEPDHVLLADVPANALAQFPIVPLGWGLTEVDALERDVVEELAPA